VLTVSFDLDGQRITTLDLAELQRAAKGESVRA
jgi:hypothetical protein